MAGHSGPTPLIPALSRQRQGTLCEFETSLGYSVLGHSGLHRKTLWGGGAEEGERESYPSFFSTVKEEGLKKQKGHRLCTVMGTFNPSMWYFPGQPGLKSETRSQKNNNKERNVK